MPTRVPDVLLIHTDQWNARALSCLGSDLVRTPNLDRLAGDSWVYTNARCNHPLCLPSRVSMLTGRYPSTTEQFGFAGFVRQGTRWLHQMFKDYGYRTGAWGKFHCRSLNSDEWNWDEAVPTLPEDMNLARPTGNTYRAYCEAHGLPYPTDQNHGHVPWDLARKQRVPSSAKPEMSNFRKQSCRSDVPLEHSLERFCANHCINFLSRRTRQPAFAYLTLDRPHQPCALPSPWYEQIDPSRMTHARIPTPAQLAGQPPLVVWNYLCHSSILTEKHDEIRFAWAAYFKLIEFIDDEIGRIITHLKSSGRYDDTAIVFTADHGEEAGYRGLFEKTCRTYSEEITRVPLFIKPARGMGFASPRRSDDPVELIDVLPTLLDLAGLPVPADIDGQSVALRPAKRKNFTPRPFSVCEQYYARSLVKGDWKFVATPETKDMALYDLSKDPLCFDNLVNNPRHRRKRLELKLDMLRFLTERRHGKFDARDVAEIERNLDPASESTPPCLCGPNPQVAFYRAMLAIIQPDFTLFVPLYDRAPMLFRNHNRNGYYKSNEALNSARHGADIERLVNYALKEAFNWTHSLSVFDPPRSIEVPTAISLAALYKAKGVRSGRMFAGR